MATTYPISEIFYSIQGEGLWAGTPMTFVRFAACNYKCSWCDTDFSRRSTLTAGGIVEAAAKLLSRLSLDQIRRNRHRVCFTGGEPCLYDLSQIMTAIGCDARFHIETNGSRHHARYLDRAFVTVSPKNPDGSPIDGGQWACDELKLVYQGQDLRRFGAFNMHGEPSAKFIQPLWAGGTMSNIDECVQVVEENPGWRLSLQTQKIIGVR